jgi:hypothetical protein
MGNDIPFEFVAAVLNGSFTQRRLYHGTQTPCWAPATRTAYRPIKPDDPVCDGFCLELAVEAIGRLQRHETEIGALNAGRLYGLAGFTIGQIQRERRKAAGRFTRFDRFDPDHPRFEDRKSGAPKWYRQALPDDRSRRRAYAMLRRVGANDVFYGTPWPYREWAEEDELSDLEELALIHWIVERLRTADEEFVAKNLEEPLSGARWMGEPGEGELAGDTTAFEEVVLDWLCPDDDDGGRTA